MVDATQTISGTAQPLAQTRAASRDAAIDSMRGFAILMVIGIHSLQQPLDASWKTMFDAALRSCVPIFLFASGYLTALSGRVPLGKRVMAALIPYTIAFVAAYLYMALQNPAMDHRPTTTIARFVLAYVFVYYYVFVYLGCTLMLWLTLWFAHRLPSQTDERLRIVLMLALVLGLIIGSYLDPLLMRRGLSEGLIEEVRMRNIPFWFSFVALGMLVGRSSVMPVLRQMRLTLTTAALLAYVIYAAVRLLGIGDAADYDSMAFFGYAAALCMLLLALGIRAPVLATLGSGSYFIYLWHIFIVMALRDHGGLRQFGSVAGTFLMYAITVTLSVVALLAVQRWAPPRAARWLGA
jgi:surface polysaccharide O-acyltransferase-like enzyme